jgi:hypothetical protein
METFNVGCSRFTALLRLDLTTFVACTQEHHN